MTLISFRYENYHRENAGVPRNMPFAAAVAVKPLQTPAESDTKRRERRGELLTVSSRNLSLHTAAVVFAGPGRNRQREKERSCNLL